MSFLTPDLPYAYNALEPYIDEQTMRVHHDKHHAAYTAKFNAAIEGTEYANRRAEEVLVHIDSVPASIRSAVQNNGGGHVNHALFWEIMAPNGKGGGGEPEGHIAAAIERAFGTFADFVKKFTEAAVGRFGSGWAWLALDNSSLEILSTANQDSPLSQGKIPLLAIDVWEHAYYLKYQNRRPEYVENWFHLINWKKVNELYTTAL